MKKVIDLLHSLPGAAILCVGDIMVDRFVYGEALRLSPEAPIPVVRIRHTDSMPGGMGNVVRNLGELGVLPLAASVVGCDDNAHILAELFMQSGWLPPIMIRDGSRPTIVKTRIIAGKQHVVRIDDESVTPMGDEIEGKLIEAVRRHMGGVKAVVLSDYGKGVVSTRVAAEVIAMARAAGVPIVVDPKGADYAKYAGATVITPNRKELMEAAGRELDSVDAMFDAALDLTRRHDIGNILVTLSEDGMMIVPAGAESPVLIPSVALDVAEISGAGDTVVALVATSIGVGAPLPLAAKLATLAAGVVVGKVGTAVASPAEIEAMAAASGNLFPDASD